MYDFAMLFLMLIGFAVLAVILLLAAQIASILMIAIKEIRSTCTSPSDAKDDKNSTTSRVQDQNIKVESAKKLTQPLQVPDLDPFAIAPNLAKPPKAAGDFGQKADNK